jgi:O-antigen ligase
MKLLAPERLERLIRFLWAVVLVTLPVTSFPFIPFLGALTQVRPLSIYPAAVLLVLLGIRCIQERQLRIWSNAFLPLLIFAMVALFSSAAGILFAPINLYQGTYLGRVLRAWITLAVGVVFLITSIGINRNEQDLKFTLKWLYVGFAIQAGWSVVQLFSFYVPNELVSNVVGKLVNSVQITFVVAGLAPHQRISGLALEPSWLAAQILTTYVPFAFASLLNRYRWNRHAWLAPAILFVSLLLLIFTYSRSGILIAAVAMLLTILFAGWQQIKQALHWFLHPFHLANPTLWRRTLETSLRVFIIITILVGVTGGINLLGQNSYFAQIWKSNKTDLVSYFVDIYAGPRLAYAWAGWTIFVQHPWTGVGLGASGLYIRDALPDWAHFNIPEISILLSPENTTYPNAKNLYIRLLAETGILGFWVFVSFLLLVLGKILTLSRSVRKELIFIGMAGLLSWLAIFALGLSQDSLAMPTVWLPLGIFIGLTGLKA